MVLAVDELWGWRGGWGVGGRWRQQSPCQESHVSYSEDALIMKGQLGRRLGCRGLRWRGGRLQPSVLGFLSAKCLDAHQTQRWEEHLGRWRWAKRSRCQRGSYPGQGPGLGEWPLSSELFGISIGLSGASVASQLPDGGW